MWSLVLSDKISPGILKLLCNSIRDNLTAAYLRKIDIKTLADEDSFVKVYQKVIAVAPSKHFAF